METSKQGASGGSDRELMITRVINAPRELVFEACTNPIHLTQWWGPNGFTTQTHHMEVAPGGMWLYTMHGADGIDYVNKVVYEEVVQPEKLLFTMSDASGNGGDSFKVTMLFEEHGSKTTLHMRMVFATSADRDRIVKEAGAVEGNKQTFDRLEAYLPTMQDADKQDLVLVRELKAPRELVYKVWTEAEHLAHWWGPVGMDIKIHRFDFEPEGIFLYSMEAPNGHIMYGRFRFVEMNAPEKMVFVNSFADAEGNIIRTDMLPDWPLEIHNTLTLTENNGKTTLTLRGRPINATEAELKAFNGNKQSMQQGFGGTFAQLEAYLQKL